MLVRFRSGSMRPPHLLGAGSGKGDSQRHRLQAEAFPRMTWHSVGHGDVRRGLLATRLSPRLRAHLLPVLT